MSEELFEGSEKARRAVPERDCKKNRYRCLVPGHVKTAHNNIFKILSHRFIQTQPWYTWAGVAASFLRVHVFQAKSKCDACKQYSSGVVVLSNIIGALLIPINTKTTIGWIFFGEEDWIARMNLGARFWCLVSSTGVGWVGPELPG